VSKKLKIASWNINSVRARTALVERLITEHQPDILCLQETKVMDNIFPFELFDRHGYVHRQLNGQRMHHGVAILSRVPLRDPGKHDWHDNGEARTSASVSTAGSGSRTSMFLPEGTFPIEPSIASSARSWISSNA
jgi:exodeoxyribonuclease-3